MYMEYSVSDTTCSTASGMQSPPSLITNSSTSPSPQAQAQAMPMPMRMPMPMPAVLIALSPCAACKILRRRCADGCVLAPYFPPTEPGKFSTAHRVFGASNIIKLLQELPEGSRADAATSMVYEAEARVRDPVYGCAGAVCRLHKQVNELKVQLARAQADLLNVQAHYANLVQLLQLRADHDVVLLQALYGGGHGSGSALASALWPEAETSTQQLRS